MAIINLSTDEKVERIYSEEKYCLLCDCTQICTDNYRPCAFSNPKDLIDYTKVNEIHKKLFGF